MTDIMLAWHPVMIAKELRAALGDKPTRKVAVSLGLSVQELGDLLCGIEGLTPMIAARLTIEYKIDGRRLYMQQEERRFEIQRRYETGELKRPNWSFHLDKEAVPA